MKPFEKIKADTQIQRITLTGAEGSFFGGTLLFHGGKRALNFVCSIDNGQWEHVSISVANERRKLPTWDEMCAAKDLFWEKEEEVHQIHPKESEYLHGISEHTNILHLWRPVGGWAEEEKHGEATADTST